MLDFEKAKKLIKELRICGSDHDCDGCHRSKEYNGCDHLETDAADMIERLVEHIERKTVIILVSNASASGKWLERDCGLDVECKCSACGYKDFVPKHDRYWFHRNFCPNCGAVMREAHEK